jgi:hypothetical protein
MVPIKCERTFPPFGGSDRIKMPHGQSHGEEIAVSRFLDRSLRRLTI